MSSEGLVTVDAVAAMPAPAGADAEERVYRVTLAYVVFGQIEVRAGSVAQAIERAEAVPQDANREFSTVPYATRVCIRKPIDFRDLSKGWEWVECPRGATRA